MGMDTTQETTHQLIHGDCLEILRSMPTDSVDLVVTSPPYEDCRSYGIEFKLRGQDWVDWAFERFVECHRVSRGLVAWVVEGKTRNFSYSGTPQLLSADLLRAGIRLRKPPIYYRVGISGSGGPDWWRNDYETVICASKGKLPWSHNTAMGHPPKCPPGGNPSHHSRDGRINRPRLQRENGIRRVRTYTPPAIANPGNVIKCHGGGGHMGDKLAHESEAPFPEFVAECFVRSFCPPGGTVLDPFVGSGTTSKVAKRFGRNSIGIDIRDGVGGLDTARRRLGLVGQ